MTCEIGARVTNAELDELDFFRAKPLWQNPYPYYEHLRSTARCGASRTTTS